MRLAILAFTLLAVSSAGAADTPAAPTPPVPVAAPDPTAAVVAEGRFIYRQRDLDALLMIAKRHARGQVPVTEQESLRLALVRLLTAREALVDALTGLPPSYTGKAREALILDLVDYQAELARRPATAAPVAGVPAATAPAAGSRDPVLVRLPPLTMHRVIKGQKRQVTLGLALYFSDPEQAGRLEAQAPLIQDAILATAQKLPDAQFSEPDQAALKESLLKAVQAKVPGFPADGILIPQLDTGDGTPGDAGK